MPVWSDINCRIQKLHQTFQKEHKSAANTVGSTVGNTVGKAEALQRREGTPKWAVRVAAEEPGSKLEVK